MANLSAARLLAGIKTNSRNRFNCAKCNVHGHTYIKCLVYPSTSIFQLNTNDVIIKKYINMDDVLQQNPTYNKVRIYKSLSGFYNTTYGYKWRWSKTSVDTDNPTEFINYHNSFYKCPKCKEFGHQYINCKKYSSMIVKQFDTNNNVLKTYDNINDVLTKNSTFRKCSIYKALSGLSKNNFAYGFKWKWSDM